MNRESNSTLNWISLGERLADDNRVRVVHVAVVTVLCWHCEQQGGGKAFRISRREVMKAAKIKGLATYHSCMRDLVAWGYIEYAPSYHPQQASRVSWKQ